jgi:hypothetical protein
MPPNSIQETPVRADVAMSAMQTLLGEHRRTIVAMLSASVISLVVWGLVVVLNVH